MNYRTGERDLDAAIRAHPWMDFSLVHYDETRAVVRGTLDESYGYQLEIEFFDVGYLDCPSRWRTDTSAEVFSKPEASALPSALRRRYFDNNGGDVFRFAIDGFDGTGHAHIVARAMRFRSAEGSAYFAW